MTLTIQGFEKFAKHLIIDSKEDGLRPLFPLYGSQKYFVEQIIQGFSEGIHEFWVDKGRQVGISTACWGLDLYFTGKFDGTQGAIVVDEESNRDLAKATITGYLDSLPKEYRIPIKVHNRNLLELMNRSRLNYMVAGKRKNDSLGQGKGLNFLHATEVASYGDDEGLNSLIASLASHKPNRLYIFESTAKGFNLWYERWMDACNSLTAKALFIGWWLCEKHDVAYDSQIHKVYGGDGPTNDEWEWVDQIKKRYGHEITTTQLAWWRWKLKEQYHDREEAMMQNFPPLPELSFVVTGSKFFSAKSLRKYQETPVKTPATYRYAIGANFEDTRIHPCGEKIAQLKIWEEPSQIGWYVIGADPAYGSSENADRYCIQVFRCFIDGISQVAELTCSDMTTYAFAWAICHLAGAYTNSTLMLEVNGPGTAVFQEIQRLQTSGGNSTGIPHPALLDVLSSIRHYLYHRPDSMTGSYAYHWKTNGDNKERIFEQLRDVFERGIIEINSRELLEEMRYIVRELGAGIGGSSKHKDDRVMATTLAVEAWLTSVLPELYENKVTRARSMARELELKTTGKADVLQSTIANFMDRFQQPQGVM